MVEERRQLNVKVPQDIWEKLEESELPRQNIVTDALRLYFDRDLHTSTTNEKDLRSDIEYLRDENKKLLELLGREQALHLTTQQKLLPAPDNGTKKPWWRFWK